MRFLSIIFRRYRFNHLTSGVKGGKNAKQLFKKKKCCEKGKLCDLVYYYNFCRITGCEKEKK
jgi:hypothetical protein